MIVRIALALVLVFTTWMPLLASCFGGNITFGYPEHDCRKPDLPFCVASRNCTDTDLSLFKLDLDSYSRCIDKYVEQVDADICCVREKRNEAVEEFNRFIRSVKSF